jgi:hypothetical protein
MKTLFFSLTVSFFATGLYAQNLTHPTEKVTEINAPKMVPKDSIFYELADGRKVTKAQLDSIFQKAWDESFGEITKEDVELLFGGNNVYVEIERHI